MPETRNYPSQIEVGKRYRDISTAFEGKCTALAFFEHGCERCTLKGMDSQGRIVEYSFDAPEVELITKGAPEPVAAVQKKPGGPHDSAPMRRR